MNLANRAERFRVGLPRSAASARALRWSRRLRAIRPKTFRSCRTHRARESVDPWPAEEHRRELAPYLDHTDPVRHTQVFNRCDQYDAPDVPSPLGVIRV